MPRHILTGGPGVGKTTLLNLLQQRGCAVFPEAARQIITEQQPSGILPWTNLPAFQKLTLERQLLLESLEHDTETTHHFHDRGVIDGIAYCRTGNIPLPPDLHLSSLRSTYTTIFLLEPLQHYTTDEQRKEDPLLARTLHDAIHTAYLDYGYTPIHVPALPPPERADFILNYVGGKDHANTTRSTNKTHQTTKTQN